MRSVLHKGIGGLDTLRRDVRVRRQKPVMLDLDESGGNQTVADPPSSQRPTAAARLCTDACMEFAGEVEFNRRQCRRIGNPATTFFGITAGEVNEF